MLPKHWPDSFKYSTLHNCTSHNQNLPTGTPDVHAHSLQSFCYAKWGKTCEQKWHHVLIENVATTIQYKTKAGRMGRTVCSAVKNTGIWHWDRHCSRKKVTLLPSSGLFKICLELHLNHPKWPPLLVSTSPNAMTPGVHLNSPRWFLLVSFPSFSLTWKTGYIKANGEETRRRNHLGILRCTPGVIAFAFQFDIAGCNDCNSQNIK